MKVIITKTWSYDIEDCSVALAREVALKLSKIRQPDKVEIKKKEVANGKN
jgi:hypothetical protein